MVGIIEVKANGGVCVMLQVKIIIFRLNLQPTSRFILNFLSLLTLIIHELGLGDKEIENQPGLKEI